MKPKPRSATIFLIEPLAMRGLLTVERTEYSTLACSIGADDAHFRQPAAAPSSEAAVAARRRRRPRRASWPARDRRTGAHRAGRRVARSGGAGIGHRSSAAGADARPGRPARA